MRPFFRRAYEFDLSIIKGKTDLEVRFQVGEFLKRYATAKAQSWEATERGNFLNWGRARSEADVEYEMARRLSTIASAYWYEASLLEDALAKRYSETAFVRAGAEALEKEIRGSTDNLFIYERTHILIEAARENCVDDFDDTFFPKVISAALHRIRVTAASVEPGTSQETVTESSKEDSNKASIESSKEDSQEAPAKGPLERPRKNSKTTSLPRTPKRTLTTLARTFSRTLTTSTRNCNTSHKTSSLNECATACDRIDQVYVVEGIHEKMRESFEAIQQAEPLERQDKVAGAELERTIATQLDDGVVEDIEELALTTGEFYKLRRQAGSPLDLAFNEQSTEKDAEKSLEELFEDFLKRSREESEKESNEEPIEESDEEPTEDSLEDLFGESDEEPTEELSEESDEESDEEPTEDSLEDLSEESDEDSLEDFYEESDEEPTEDSLEDLFGEFDEESLEDSLKDEESLEDSIEGSDEESNEEPIEDPLEGLYEESDEDSLEDEESLEEPTAGSVEDLFGESDEKKPTNNSLGFALLTEYATQYGQSYFSLVIYFFLALGLCGLLAGLAYLLSLSTAQETEKRSEYECGFAPFDSATRLPFDVHFYLVGILFLIFDVEVALLFPWVLSLRTIGWFGFYLMLAFLLVLSIGFLFEWKRGALLWPSRRFVALVSCRDPELQYKGELIEEFTPGQSYELIDIIATWHLFYALEYEIWLWLVWTDLSFLLAFFPTVVVPLLPEGLFFTLICFVITALSLFLGKRRKGKPALILITWKALRFSLLVLTLMLGSELLVGASGSGPVFNGYFEESVAITVLRLAAALTGLFVMDLASNYLEVHRRDPLEFTIMLAFAIFFMLLLVSAAHVMSVFLSLVGFSLGFYVLIMYDANQHPSREAGLKYYYLSAMSSGLILYGLLLLYIVTTTGTFSELLLFTSVALPGTSLKLVSTGIMFALIGFFFKLSVAPGHLWAADVYEGSPAPVLALFMLPAKLSVFAAFLALFPTAVISLSRYWLPILAIASMISVIWGALAAVPEKKLRRFLAYASISTMGIIVSGFSTDSDAGVVSGVLYMLAYLVMSAVVLGVVLVVVNKDGRQLAYLTDFRSLAAAEPVFASALTIAFFSMAGVPPFAGFYPKYLLLQELFLAGLYGQVIIILIFSLVSTFYYLKANKQLNFMPKEAVIPFEDNQSTLQAFILGLLVGLLAFAGLYFTELYDWASDALLDPLGEWDVEYELSPVHVSDEAIAVELPRSLWNTPTPVVVIQRFLHNFRNTLLPLPAQVVPL